jgi:4-hydroxy-3-methylbut-2-enyl diphosphate reductase
MTNYNIGDVVDAKIVKLMTFGAFAEILPGVDGLIHISQIADKRIGKPEDVLAEGQEVQVKITDVDAENKRISLSIRALLETAPAEEEVVEAE